MISNKPYRQIDSASGVYSDYDILAMTYDDIHSSPESLAENDTVIQMIGDVSGKTVLDIGCGTGLLWDYLTFDPGAYVGFDPSAAMLDQFIKKHPDVVDDGVLYQAKLEDFSANGRKFDLVVSTFGSLAYADGAHIEAIPSRFVAPGGRYFLMFLADDYHPVTYERAGVELEHQTGVFADIPGTQTRFGGFIIVEGTV